MSVIKSEISQLRRQSDVKQLKKAVYAVVSLLESTSRHEPWRDRPSPATEPTGSPSGYEPS